MFDFKGQMYMGSHQQSGDHQRVHRMQIIFDASPITIVFFVEEIQAVEFYPYFDITQTWLTSKRYSFKSVEGVTNNVDIIRKYT